MYSENQVAGGRLVNPRTAAGEGKVRDDIHVATNKRAIANLVLIGYSWGGGSVHSLAHRLSYDQRRLIDIDLLLTGYVDAVSQHGKIWGPEQKRPPGAGWAAWASWITRLSSAVGTRRW